jgi:capsular exopolysaccharide synthesis family protein
MNNAIVRAETVDLNALSINKSEFPLEEIKQIVYRRWKPALAMAIVASTGMFLFKALQTPQYMSETQILVENPKTEQSAPVSLGEERIDRYYSIKDLTTEILVLRSHEMTVKALKTIQDEYPELQAAGILSNLNIYQAVINQVPTDVLIISYVDTDPERAKAVLDALGSTYVEYSLEKQRLQAANGIKFIDTQLTDAQQELEDAAKAIRQFRQVNQMVDPDSSAIQVSEIKGSLEEQIQITTTEIQINKNQLQEINYQLAQLGQDSETMVASSVLGQDGVYQNLASQLKSVETEYNLGKVTFHDTYHVMKDLKERRAELKKLLQERAEQVLGKSISPSVLERILLSTPNTDSSSVESTADTTSTSDVNIDSVETNTIEPSASALSFGEANNTNSNPQSSGTKVSSEGSTLGNLANQKLQLEQKAAILDSKLQGLLRTQSQLVAKFEQIPGLQQTFAELQRKLELKSEAYNYLLKRKQQLEVTKAEETAPWRVLNTPFLPAKPISPDIPQAILLAIIAGGFCGITTAFLLHKMDRRIMQVEEVKEITRLPIVGIIPKVDEPKVNVDIHTTRRSYSYYSSFTEGLRSLAMNLRYLVTETGRIKTLAITSSTSAEGKTTISYNLAMVLAEFNLRVLIVDGDLRKPKLHKLTNLQSERGLSDAITTDHPWTDFIKTSNVENLDIITSGGTSPNPIALLNSDKMKQLIQQWQEVYDYVLIDTPPIGVITDAKTIANQVDTILFVTGIQRVSRKAMSNALDILYGSQCNIAGVVVNMVDPNFDYYAYSYYDSYYNQSPQNDANTNDDNNSENKISNILQQFRRRQ